MGPDVSAMAPSLPAESFAGVIVAPCGDLYFVGNMGKENLAAMPLFAARVWLTFSWTLAG